MAANAPHRTPDRRRMHARLDTAVSDKKRLYGLWQADEWWCNCMPRKKAALREVRSNTPNRGKLYLRCPVYPSCCHFFLWQQEALVRAAGPSSPNGHRAVAQSPPRPKTPALTQPPLTSFGVSVTPGRSAAEEGSGHQADGIEPEDDQDARRRSTHCNPHVAALLSKSAPPLSMVDEARPLTPRRLLGKRSRALFEQQNRDEDGPELSDFGSDDERQLADLADCGASRSNRNKDAFASPPDDAIHLSAPRVARTLFPSSRPKRQKVVTFQDPRPYRMPSPVRDPHVGRPGSSEARTSRSPRKDDPDVTVQVMGLLRSQPVDEAVLDSVYQLLAVFDLRAKGLALGSDAARNTLKQRDSEITRLSGRNATLESQLTTIKARLMTLYQDN